MSLYPTQKGTLMLAAAMMALKHDLPLEKIVTKKAGVDHSHREAKRRRKAAKRKGFKP